MNFNFSDIETGSNILDWLLNIIQAVFTMLGELCDAMFTFYDMLKDFNDQINLMVYDPAAGSGLPVIEAIGVVRYLVGDVVFYVLYIIILFGCLSTIYRLVCLLIEAKDGLVEQVTSGNGSGGFIASIIEKFR